MGVARRRPGQPGGADPAVEPLGCEGGTRPRGRAGRRRRPGDPRPLCPGLGPAGNDWPRGRRRPSRHRRGCRSVARRAPVHRATRPPRTGRPAMARRLGLAPANDGRFARTDFGAARSVGFSSRLGPARGGRDRCLSPARSPGHGRADRLAKTSLEADRPFQEIQDQRRGAGPETRRSNSGRSRTGSKSGSVGIRSRRWGDRSRAEASSSRQRSALPARLQ